MTIKIEYEAPEDLAEMFDEKTLVSLAKLILNRYYHQDYLYDIIEDIQGRQ